MTDEDVIERLHEVMGLGKVYGPYQRVTGKAYWTWRTNRIGDVRPGLELLLPWLGQRRSEKALEALGEVP